LVGSKAGRWQRLFSLPLSGQAELGDILTLQGQLYLP